MQNCGRSPDPSAPAPPIKAPPQTDPSPIVRGPVLSMKGGLHLNPLGPARDVALCCHLHPSPQRTPMITEIEDYFSKGCGRCDRFKTLDCSTRHWAQGLAELRALCLAAGLEEAVKWGHPCYMIAGRNIVIFGAFRGDFRLTFFNAGLMTDPDGVMERQGRNTRTPDMIRFTQAAQVAQKERLILRYLAEAMAYARAGIKAESSVGAAELPTELVDALDSDPDLSEAFAALSPGRRKSYVIALAQARASATRVARIARFRGKILQGKGANEY